MKKTIRKGVSFDLNKTSDTIVLKLLGHLFGNKSIGTFLRVEAFRVYNQLTHDEKKEINRYVLDQKGDIDYGRSNVENEIIKNININDILDKNEKNTPIGEKETLKVDKASESSKSDVVVKEANDDDILSGFSMG